MARGAGVATVGDGPAAGGGTGWQAAAAASRTRASRRTVRLTVVKGARGGLPTLGGIFDPREGLLMAWRELFGTDVGLASLFAILFVIGIGIFLALWVRRRIREEMPAPTAGGTGRATPPQA